MTSGEVFGAADAFTTGSPQLYMCGIFFSCSGDTEVTPSAKVLNCLNRRGPDHIKRLSAQSSLRSLSFISSVLSLRGEVLTSQPLQDPSTGSILCWNGEAWSIDGDAVKGNDAVAVFNLLLQAIYPDVSAAASSRPDSPAVNEAIANALQRVRGPYAFVFYTPANGKIFYGRDVLGRRSLLMSDGEDGDFMISSVCNGISSGNWSEVDANGIHVLDLSNESPAPSRTCIPWPEFNRLYLAASSITPQLLPDQSAPPLGLNSPAVDNLFIGFRHSMALRATSIPTPPSDHTAPAKLAILFSGGLDCSLLARIVHDLLPLTEDVDLLNVAFENPRVLKAANANNTSPTSGYLQCPDRITGLSSHAELQQVCPGRTWRFVSIDVPYTETMGHRPQITNLIYPHNTEMDLSIACALYFAARGKGTVEHHASNEAEPYSTPARVLLSGLGADEIFAGYTRHATAFARRSYQGLSDELDLDFHRLGKRNLGRDDRVISHWGREVRYPYLDEDFLHWALKLPVWEK
ncbi:MAG: hypothetical protein Q9174_005748, partial [Haloplaca sp. 1 TL-2023]